MDRNARHGWLLTALAGALIVSAIMGTVGVPASSGSATRVSRERVAEQTVRAAAEQRMGGSWLVFNRLSCRRSGAGFFACEVGFFVGDALWEGKASVRFSDARSPRYVLRLIRARYLCRGLRCARPIRWCSGKC